MSIPCENCQHFDPCDIMMSGPEGCVESCAKKHLYFREVRSGDEECPKHEPTPKSWDPPSPKPAMPFMELRDYFAAQALVGLLQQENANHYTDAYRASKSAYDAADAMLKERSRRMEEES